ncbi:MAG: NADH-quinone oxidoreductase subunit L [Caldilineaceae bacterium]|jgi:NADH-quinone oxidoreductase subunit L|nr:NADH-quinone oxidoreductase subunit L [Caldilineaceae bacterium]
MLESVWLLFALPALGALIILFAGRWMSQKVVGWVASAAVLGAFLVAVSLWFSLAGLPAEARSVTVTWWEWMTIGAFRVPAAVLIDPLSVIMALVVTGVGFLIHVYSIGYMEHEPRYQRFFFYMNFFILAMLTLVMSNNFLGMFVGWEGVGLASFLLIGFWFDKRDDMYGWYADAGKKAFIVNRIGDFGMILAMIMVWSTVGTLIFTELGAAVHNLAPATATIICLLLLLGATGKSAQIPLYIWLPDAMAGPTPVSALIHAATMVTAGVYMIIRTNALWHLSLDAGLTTAWIGMVTALLAASIALVQTDLKKILAYSTISQLGFMIAAAGLGAYGAALFHLVTHAFFKALLFLAAGSVMHATDGILDINRLGGLRHKMPTTYRTFLIGAAALAGIPLFSGFFSKDAILVIELQRNVALYLIGAVAALLTAIYSFRAVFVTFHGQPRDQHIYDHAHESPSVMTIPLWILAVLSVAAGVINLPFVLTLDHWLEPVIGEHEQIPLVLELLGITLSIVIAVFGVLIARARYLTHEPWVARLEQPFAFLKPTLEHRWYVDDLYAFFIVSPLKGVSGWFARVFDPKVIDGAVNGVGGVINGTGEVVRKVQNGAIPTYALSILLGVVAVLFYFLFVG